MSSTAELAARAIQQVRASYGEDLSAIELMPPGVERETLATLYRGIYRELARAAIIAATGNDPGDAGGFGKTMETP